MKKLCIMVAIACVSQAATTQAEAKPEAKGKWNPLHLRASVEGCVQAQLEATKRDYVARGTQAGNPRVADEFPIIEGTLKEEFNRVCSCVFKEIASKYALEEFTANAQSISAAAMAEVARPPGGKCMINMQALQEKLAKHKDEIEKLQAGQAGKR